MSNEELDSAMAIIEQFDGFVKAVIEERDQLRADLAESERQHDVIVQALRKAWVALGSPPARAAAS